MSKLLCFVSGVIFISTIIPCLDGFVTVVLAWFEKIKAKQAEIINSINIKIKNDAQKDNPDIEIAGFASVLQEEEEEENDI